MSRLQLKVPFRTADSVLLVWDKQAPDIRYDIEVNGQSWNRIRNMRLRSARVACRRPYGSGLGREARYWM